MFEKGLPVTGFAFGMINKNDGSIINAGVVTATIAIDGAGAIPLTDTPTYSGSAGIWQVDLTAAEMNGDVIGLAFEHALAVPAYFTIKTMPFSIISLPAGIIDFTYTLVDGVTLLPIADATILISTDNARANIVWKGITDAFGVARDLSTSLPALNPGTYFFWRYKSKWIGANPDIEIVS